MIHLIILIAFVAAMSAMGISALEVAIAAGMGFACIGALNLAERWVQQRTGRTASTPTEQYKAVGFLLALIIGLPPIFLLQGYNILVLIALQLIGTVVGSVVAQAFFGKRMA